MCRVATLFWRVHLAPVQSDGSHLSDARRAMPHGWKRCRLISDKAPRPKRYRLPAISTRRVAGDRTPRCFCRDRTTGQPTRHGSRWRARRGHRYSPERRFDAAESAGTGSIDARQNSMTCGSFASGGRSVSPNYFRSMSRSSGFLNLWVIRPRFHALLQYLACRGEGMAPRPEARAGHERRGRY
jgi:hypothetical protein